MSEAITFQAPATIAIGSGASELVADHAVRLGTKRALLVTDPFINQSGIAEAVSERLRGAGIETTVFADVQPDPTDSNVEAGVEKLREVAAEVVVAVGGGSALDAAKMVAVRHSNEGPISNFMGYHKIPNPGLPLIAIPTTAGTGSEATRVAVITDAEHHTKMMVLDGTLVPDVALVDFELTLTMPPALTAHVGVDTLTHGIEAYVSVLANPLTDPYALSCVRLVGENLVNAWTEPEHRAARAGMSVAACQGGIAFANASVCLVHGMSRPLGAVFGIPHGLSNAVLLPTITAYSVGGAPDRYAAVARTLGAASNDDGSEDACQKLIEFLERLNQDLKVPRLRELADREKFDANLEKMAADALASGSPDRNPVVPTTDEIVELYRRAW
jgi:alcohol dehydrogenase class IV